VGFGVLNDNLIKCLISFVKVYEQILSKSTKVFMDTSLKVQL
jgi:hypothetical protein